MKKLMLFMGVILLVFSFGMASVHATSAPIYTLDSTVSDAKCKGILGDPKEPNTVAYFLQEIFTIIKFVAPALVIILTIVEFVKAIPSQDKDLLKKASQNTVKRVAIAIVLFFSPTIINVLLSWFGLYSTCGIG